MAKCFNEDLQFCSERNIRDEIPRIYRESDPQQIPLWSELPLSIRRWAWDATGVGIVGPTGAGKSRSLALIAMQACRIAKPYGPYDVWFPDLAWCNEADFARLAASQYSDRDAKIRLTWLRNRPILVLDDIGQGKATASMAGELYALLEHRTTRDLPTLWSSQYRSTSLVARFDTVERGQAIVRRLDEFAIVHATREGKV